MGDKQNAGHHAHYPGRDTMTHTSESAAVHGLPSSDAGKAPLRRWATLALPLAIASLVITAVLGLLSPAFAFLAAVLVAAAAGVAGLVLSITARRNGSRRGVAGWALTFSVVGLLTNFVLIGVMVVGVLSHSQLTQVEVRAQGGLTFTVTFADDSQTYTEEWASTGWKQFTTTKSSTEITVTAPKDGVQLPVSCQIVWNGKTVVDKTSDNGTVTCHYDAE
jgi:hypothetical protein